MSWNYTMHQINRSFEQIAHWYQEFLHRSESAFRALHERVLLLEQQQTSSQGPSDEQVERVLRKVLAERFGDTRHEHVESPGLSRDPEYFVKPPDSGISIPRAPPIDPMLLLVDPEAVPSRVYGQTIKMLTRGLSQYPQMGEAKPVIQDTTSEDGEVSKCPEPPRNHGRPW